MLLFTNYLNALFYFCSIKTILLCCVKSRRRASSRRDVIFVTADFNRRAAYLTFSPLSHRDNIKYVKCCHAVTKEKNRRLNPPIEIGGYKYYVPMGR